MAPSQRGLRVLIKRGRNGGIAKLNAPIVCINIEHVICCEPRQLASDVPKCKTTEFVEAPLGSAWFQALETADCKELMTLLEENPCRVVQKGKGGRTVLHAAAERGCLKLLDQVFDLFGDNDDFEDEKEAIQLPQQKLLKAEHIYDGIEKRVGAAGLTAWEYAWWSIGQCEAREYLLHGRRGYLKRFVYYQSEIFNSSITDNPGAVEEGSLSPRTLLLEVLEYRRSVLSDRNRSEFEENREYNFVGEFEELRFHHACTATLHNNFRKEYREYVKAVIAGCAEKGPRVLRYLFQLRNAQGQTPLHAALCRGDCSFLVGLIPGRASGENAECLNMRDSRGWTALHHIAARLSHRGIINLRGLLEDGRADVNATVKPWKFDCAGLTGATALHLAVLHNRSEAVERLLQHPKTDVNAFLYRRIYFDDNVYVNRNYLTEWTALQLAAVAGLPEMVKELIKCPKVKDVGKRQKRGVIKRCTSLINQQISAVHLAAASGDPETLRLFITNQQFDPLVTFDGSTSLHFAVASSHPTCIPPSDDKSTYIFNCFLKMEDFGDFVSYLEAKVKDTKIVSYRGREACISILVQAGVNVWQKDDAGNFPEPGRSASSENHLSWQQKVAHETLEAKKSLNEAGNAISVVAALVATTSYVGPLQPPLSYANDVVQTSTLLVRIFMVTNSLSFYLAIASIMFAVVPSLPMPQEGIYEEWQRTQQTIGIAISLLLMSVIGVLISFAAASNAVVPEEYSWRHGGLTFYPAVLGGLICLIGIIWFFIRLLRLIFPKSVEIRSLYQNLSQIKEKKK